MNRREFLGTGGAAVGLPLAGPGQEARKLKVAVVGGHPDDPESGCGGAVARYADRGDEVVVFYLTRGERGIGGKPLEEAARIRTAEAEKACEILKARARFVGQIDGETELNPKRYDDFRKMLAEEKPDLVFTHWPVDTHRDHRAASLLAYDAWLRMGRKFALYYFEVNAGSQTQHFRPTHYVDITAVHARKRDACFAHVSQNVDNSLWPLHEAMHRFRGMECGVKAAEGFVVHVQSSTER